MRQSLASADTKKIKILLIEQDLTQRDLADRIGMTESGISRVIRGSRRSEATRVKIAKILKVAVNEIFPDKEHAHAA